MGKRSSFRRRVMDDYATPHKGVLPLLPFLKMEHITRFAEPCCGEGDLVRHLTFYELECVHKGDIRYGDDALSHESFPGADAIITNPPWTRALMHPLIAHFMQIAPTWLLFDADWAHTKQAARLIRHATHIVSVGRLKWMPDSKHQGKDNAAWYRFEASHTEGPRFFGKPWEPSLLDVMEDAA